MAREAAIGPGHVIDAGTAVIDAGTSAIDAGTAVIVCSGASLDLLGGAAWRDIARAGEIVAVNGALTADVCREYAVRFTVAAGHDGIEILGAGIPRYSEVWMTTRAWRITRSEHAAATPAESYIERARGWSDDPGRCFHTGAGGVTAANWLCNDWPETAPVADVRRRPRRGLRKLVYVGLDMVPSLGGHARGAGTYASGFSRTPEMYEAVSAGWRTFREATLARGIAVLNLTPGTGLTAIPASMPPAAWLATEQPFTGPRSRSSSL